MVNAVKRKGILRFSLIYKGGNIHIYTNVRAKKVIELESN